MRENCLFAGFVMFTVVISARAGDDAGAGITVGLDGTSAPYHTRFLGWSSENPPPGQLYRTLGTTTKKMGSASAQGYPSDVRISGNHYGDNEGFSKALFYHSYSGDDSDWTWETVGWGPTEGYTECDYDVWPAQTPSPRFDRGGVDNCSYSPY